MSSYEKIGLGALIGIMAAFALLLYLTARRPAGPGRPLEENSLVERRMEIVGPPRQP